MQMWSRSPICRSLDHRPRAALTARPIAPSVPRGLAYGVTASASFLGSFLGPFTGGSGCAVAGIRVVFVLIHRPLRPLTSCGSTGGVPEIKGTDVEGLNTGRLIVNHTWLVLRFRKPSLKQQPMNSRIFQRLLKSNRWTGYKAHPVCLSRSRWANLGRAEPCRPLEIV